MDPRWQVLNGSKVSAATLHESTSGGSIRAPDFLCPSLLDQGTMRDIVF